MFSRLFCQLIVFWMFCFLFFLKITVNKVRGVCVLRHEISISILDPGIVGHFVLGINFNFSNRWPFIEFILWCGVIRKL